jgi:tetratricopeptide (TPR) repeat protein
MCNGRVKMTMGYWTKPDFEELIEGLSQKITESENPDMNLNRGRIYLALGKSNEARSDLDVYLKQNPNDALALINRAGTRFPTDMNGVINDCSKAITLDPVNKNAFFLRGLARYEMGNKKQACEDFSKAIDLGFSILRIAEEHRCAAFWKND